MINLPRSDAHLDRVALPDMREITLVKRWRRHGGFYAAMAESFGRSDPEDWASAFVPLERVNAVRALCDPPLAPLPPGPIFWQEDYDREESGGWVDPNNPFDHYSGPEHEAYQLRRSIQLDQMYSCLLLLTFRRAKELTTHGRLTHIVA